MDIAGAVDRTEQGAGDQGIVYGYATTETLNFMPLPVELAHRLTDRLEQCRRRGIIKGLCPDGKSQVTVQFNGDRFDKIVSVLVSAQHEAWKSLDDLIPEIRKKVIGYVFAEYDMSDVEILVNPSGRFVIGGFEADTGLTGRKLMVDSYGGIAHNGGGAMSGKDASKGDRSGAYLARYIAKNIVAAGLADKVEIQLAYAIGVAKPVSILVDTFGTGITDDSRIAAAIEEIFDFRPAAIIEALGLRRPIYAKTAAYGHFGRNDLPWEQTDRIEALKAALKI